MVVELGLCDLGRKGAFGASAFLDLTGWDGRKEQVRSVVPEDRPRIRGEK